MKTSMRKLIVPAVAVSAGLVIAAAVSYGRASEPTGGAEPSIVGAEAAGAEQTAARVEEAGLYVVELKNKGSYKAGQEGVVEVVLEVRDKGYHTNAEYPFKFKVASPAADGVSYPKPLIKRAEGKIDEHKAVFEIPFVAANAGSAKVGGTLHFSICNDSTCLIKKAAVETSVAVQ